MYGTLADIAAAYAYYIVGNHPFVDGNKRAGLEAALLFLQLNGITIDAPRDVMVDAGMRLARGKMSIRQLSQLFSAYAS